MLSQVSVIHWNAERVGQDLQSVVRELELIIRATHRAKQLQ